MICPHCAFPNDPHDHVCGKCNQPLHKTSDTTPSVRSDAGAVQQTDTEDSTQSSVDFPNQDPADDINTLLEACIEEARRKEQEGGLRSAFLVCQAFVMDHYGEIPDQAILSLYTAMGQISELQGKTERAAKYLQKAQMIRDGHGPTGIASRSTTTQDKMPDGLTASHGIDQTTPIQDYDIDDMEDIDESTDSDQVGQADSYTTRDPAPDLAARNDQPLVEDYLPTPRTTRKRKDKPAARTANFGQVWTASFFIRLASFLTDVFIVTILVVLTSFIFSSILDNRDQDTLQILLDQPSTMLLGFAVWILLLLIYHCMFSRFGGQSMGKALFKIQVVGLDGRGISTKKAILRSVGLLVAGIPALAGFFWIAFDIQSRGWHDYLGGTLVIQLLLQDKNQVGN